MQKMIKKQIGELDESIKTHMEAIKSLNMQQREMQEYCKALGHVMEGDGSAGPGSNRTCVYCGVTIVE